MYFTKKNKDQNGVHNIMKEEPGRLGSIVKGYTSRETARRVERSMDQKLRVIFFRLR